MNTATVGLISDIGLDASGCCYYEKYMRPPFDNCILNERGVDGFWNMYWPDRIWKDVVKNAGREVFSSMSGPRYTALSNLTLRSAI